MGLRKKKIICDSFQGECKPWPESTLGKWILAVCALLWIHINTTFTEMRFEALQTRTSGNPCPRHKSHMRLGNHTTSSSRRAQQYQLVLLVSFRLSASLLFPLKANHRFLLALKAESPLWGIGAAIVKLVHRYSSRGSQCRVSDNSQPHGLWSSVGREYTTTC